MALSYELSAGRLAFKLLAATGDVDRRAALYEEYMPDGTPGEREFFHGMVVRNILSMYDRVHESHPGAAAGMDLLRKTIDQWDFEDIVSSADLSDLN